MIKAGIIGGANRNAGELVRLLVNHPDVVIKWVHSHAHYGRRFTDLHPGLLGETDLIFTDDLAYTDVDVVFLCLPKGEGRRFVERNSLPAGLKVVDLSGDFRLENSDNDFVYALPELNRKALVRGAVKASVPGAFATAVNLALLPLAKHLMLNRTLHVTAISGRGGDDCGIEQPEFLTLPEFSVSIAHRQTEEIRSTLRNLQASFASDIDVVAMRGPHARGLAVMIYFDSPVPADTVLPLYDEYYSDHNFTFISPRRPSLEEVVGTNKCIIHVENAGGKLVITALVDEVLKGGAGQAVHVMNLLFGLHEKVGLQLKSTVI